MDARPRLSRKVVASLAGVRNVDLELPSAAMLALPERVVQFGTGAFLRGFAEFFVDEANRRGAFNGRVVAVSSTGSSRDAELNEQNGLFTLAIQGVEQGNAFRRNRVIGSLSRAISARDQWDAVLAVARDPAITLVISNSTEVGIVLDPADTFDAQPPRSFPGKLTRFLAERGRAFDYDEQRGLIVLPCELIDENGTKLAAIVRELAELWQLDGRFQRWADRAVVFCNTLVDRIVPGIVSIDEATAVATSVGYRDELLTACEPYALFAIEGHDDLRGHLGFAGEDARIIVARDIGPYRERKVRVLNGAHTVVSSVALLAGLETVRDACDDDRVGRFLRRVVFDEIVPSVDAPDTEEFARGVLERFSNPYIRHALIDLTLYNTAKMRARVVPSIVAYYERMGRAPGSLAFGFASYLEFKRGEHPLGRTRSGSTIPDDSSGDRVRDAWRDVDLDSDVALADLARVVCADASLWGIDLTTINGFSDLVADHLTRIVRQGVRVSLDAHLTEPATT
ncbi:MAG TPA: tagaturonate reductase [Gemmatimonadaceae bacterium]|nr:tagaturonate reductase [Gemmatimonadaceae bacterium]